MGPEASGERQAARETSVRRRARRRAGAAAQTRTVVPRLTSARAGQRAAVALDDCARDHEVMAGIAPDLLGREERSEEALENGGRNAAAVARDLAGGMGPRARGAAGAHAGRGASAHEASGLARHGAISWCTCSTAGRSKARPAYAVK